MRCFDFRLLGPLEVHADDELLPLGAGKQSAVLAMLLLELNRAVPVDRVIEQLWPEKPPGRPDTAVQGYVSGLRKLLGAETVVTSGRGYLLQADPDHIDLNRFERLVNDGRASLAGGQAERAAALLHEALALWRGPALVDFAYEEWAQHEIARLDELRSVAREERLEAQLALGQHDALVGEIEMLVREWPLRERPRRQLMLALYRSGRQEEALQAYHGAREQLLEELGIDPCPELQSLYRRILNQDEALRVEARPAKPPPNLPAQTNPLIGRRRELDDVKRLLRRDGVRMLTLTGPGGTGKTRLALQAAADLADEFDRSVYFVSLAPISDAELVLSAIAQTLGLQEEPGRTLMDGLAELAGEQPLLLVLDNLEQLVPRVAPLLASLLSRLGRMSVLATSRVRLNISGEHELPVPPLSESEAVELFTDRARAVRPGFDPDPAVADICRRLDHLPLALELAAARAKVLSAVELVGRLERAMPVLIGGPTDRPERHRTLEGAIDWSYQLLGTRERTLLARLSVFAGGFSLGAAETVAGAELDGVAALMDASLLQRWEIDRGEARLGMLQTIREYASDRLSAAGEQSQVSCAHALFYADFVERLDRQLSGPEQGQRLEEIDREHDNLRNALLFSVSDHDGKLALRLAAAMGWFWYIRGHVTEGRRFLAEALALALEPSALRAKALMRAGSLAEQQGDSEAAIVHYNECLDLRRAFGDDEGVAATVNNLAIVYLGRDENDVARELFQESLDLSRKLGDEEGVASALCNLGLIARAVGDHARARPLLEESLAIARKLEHVWGCALVLQDLGVVLSELGELRGGLDALGEALELYGGLSNPPAQREPSRSSPPSSSGSATR